jgi:hypothetical protein
MEEGADDVSYKFSVSLALHQKEGVDAIGGIHGTIATSACYPCCGVIRSTTKYLLKGSILSITKEK